MPTRTNTDWAFDITSLKYYAHKAGVKIAERPNNTFSLTGGDVTLNNVAPAQIKEIVDKLAPSVVKKKTSKSK